MGETARGRYDHDCAECRFLGSYEGADLYFCAKQAFGPTLLARFGNRGPEYISGLELARIEPRLAEAKRRAISAGLPG